MEPIHTEEYKGLKIKIHHDENPDNPREWDNLGRMICFHPEYKLGDEHNYETPEEFREFSEDKDSDLAVVLPLYLYDHSGLRMKVGSFKGLLPQGHAEFDSGQAGWIYVTKAAVKKEYGKVTKKTLAHAKDVLQGKVDTYDQYLCGDIYGYRVTEAAGKKCDKCGHVEDPEELDSCWGLYGREYAVKAAKESIDNLTAEKKGA